MGWREYSLQVLTLLFPQDIEIQAGGTLSWPIWFHAATPGNVSLYISLYSEMESSCDIKYRTLRMHYNLEVTDCAPIFNLLYTFIMYNYST
jgi:hypothetical protein